MNEINVEIRRAMTAEFWNGFATCAILVFVLAAIVGVVAVVAGQPL